MLGNDTFDDAERFADARARLASCGIAIDAMNWRELSTPEASTRPDKLQSFSFKPQVADSPVLQQLFYCIDYGCADFLLSR